MKLFRHVIVACTVEEIKSILFSKYLHSYQLTGKYVTIKLRITIFLCAISFIFKIMARHTGSNPCVNQFVRLFPNYLTTNCPNISLIEKIQKNPENIQSESKIRKIYSPGQKSGSGIPEILFTKFS